MVSGVVVIDVVVSGKVVSSVVISSVVVSVIIAVVAVVAVIGHLDIIQPVDFEDFLLRFLIITLYLLMVFSFLPKNVHFISKKCNFVFVS